MPIPDQKFETYKLETKFYEGYVVHTTYQWVYSERVWGESTWEQDKVIGDGAFGEVWLEREEKGSLRAVKKLDQRSTAKMNLTQELLVMAKLQDHTHLFLELFGWYENMDHIFLAMEYIEYGNLSEYIKNTQKPTELEVKEITRQILEGLEVLHGKEICHRDLKPENVLVASTQPIWVKVADFGISKRAKNTQLWTTCGTDGYFAPELLGFFQKQGAKKRLGNQSRTEEAFTYVLDIWSLGCLVHWILTSHTPFSSTDNGDEPKSQDVGLIGSVIDMRSLRKYCKGTIDLPVEALQKSQVSEEGIGFVKSLLVANPKDRPTAAYALKSPWLKGYKNTWLEDLRNEFSFLGVDLDFKSKENIFLRQVGKADIMQFLPALNGEILSLLLRAIEKECCLAVLKILESPSCDLNIVDSLTRGKLLQIAARAGQLDKVKLLLYDKTGIDTENNYRMALQAAAGAGHIHIVRLLLDCRTDVDTSSDEEMALLVAVNGGHIEVVTFLLDRGADTNTALLAAIKGGNIEVIILLLDRGADANTALLAAVKGGHIGAVTLLLDRGADANTVLLVAVDGGNTDIVKLLLDHGVNANVALLTTTDGRHTDTVKLVLGQGANANTALLAVNDETIEVFPFLLDCEISANTALFAAVDDGNIRVVIILLDYGADVNTVHKGKTTLMAAVDGGYIGIVKLLLDSGAILNTEPKKRTASLAAAKHGYTNSVQLLFDYEAKRHIALLMRASYGHFGEVKLLLDSGADVNTESMGQTAVAMAAGGGYTDTVKLLLDRGAHVHPGSTGQIALLAAARGGYTSIIKLLLDHGVDVNVTSKGQSAIMAAANSGYTDTIKLLLDHGASIENQESLVAAVKSGNITSQDSFIS